MEEAVHYEDGRRRGREEASDSGKEGRSRERKWCEREEEVEKGCRSRRARSRQAPQPPCPRRGREGAKRKETEREGRGREFSGRYIYSGNL